MGERMELVTDVNVSDLLEKTGKASRDRCLQVDIGSSTALKGVHVCFSSVGCFYFFFFRLLLGISP